MMDAVDSTAMRERLIATARAMNAAGINRGKSGNVSVRCADGFLVTPSGLAYEGLAAEDVVTVAADGTAHGRRAPSSEWRFHRDIYASRAEARAIVHTHGPWSAALACHDRGIPAFHYMVARAGGRDIRCSRYATFGTQELSDAAVEALRDRRACLLAHHGAIALGASLDEALALAVEVESLAQMYVNALALGEPPCLDDAEMDRVVARFATYGRA